MHFWYKVLIYIEMYIHINAGVYIRVSVLI